MLSRDIAMRWIMGIMLLMLLSSCGTIEYAESYSHISKHYGKLAAEKNDSCLIPFVKAQDSLVPEGKKLMQVMLVRHGRPMISIKKWYSWRQAENYFHAYDTVDIEKFINDPICIDSTDVDTVYCSILTRSRETAEAICQGNFVLVEDKMFREFERQVIPIPLIKMPLSFWSVNARIAWILGIGKIEDYRTARQRAKSVAIFLEDNALINNRAVLVAHGFLNYVVGKQLRKRDWHQAYDGGKDFLSVAVYVKIVDDKNYREQFLSKKTEGENQ